MSETKSIPRSEYPHPHWKRKTEWTSLNGAWSFAFDDQDVGLDAKWWTWQEGDKGSSFDKTITVPFAYQTQASGVDDRAVHEVVWYARTIRRPKNVGEQDRVLLHFGAVDYEATVWVAGQQATQHEGGHVAFHCDITPHLLSSAGTSDEVPVVVRVRDAPFDVTQPRGKQYWKPEIEGIWYHPTTGIWQPVWLECVPRSRIDRAVLTTDIDNGSVTVAADLTNVGTSAPDKQTQNATVNVSVSLHGVPIASQRASVDNGNGQAHVTVGVRVDDADKLKAIQKHVAAEAWNERLALWTPETPTLYDVTITLNTSEGRTLDEVYAYTGLRKIHVEHGKVLLNNKPLFQALNLDQGYWPSGGLTAPSDEAFRIDIEAMKAIGMNGCRKHQKVEDPRFLYWADRLGYLVWGEMASPQEFSQKAILRFHAEWTEAVMQQINHPSIISWTPFNESWGVPDLLHSHRQRTYLASIYHLTKTLDPTRLCISNDGWEQGPSDVLGFHDYAEGETLRKTAADVALILKPKAGKEIILPGDPPYDGKPIICTEMGGISMEPKSNDPKGSWGYQLAGTEEDLLERIRGVVDAIVDGKIAQGFCYTQTTDVEQEVNGILTKDRTQKIDPKKLREVFGRRPS